jgi:hypothetical protein
MAECRISCGVETASGLADNSSVSLSRQSEPFRTPLILPTSICAISSLATYETPGPSGASVAPGGSSPHRREMQDKG